MRTDAAEVLTAVGSILAKDRSASMQAIADRAGVSRATLTRLFPTRQALVRAAAEKIIDDCARAVAEIGEDMSAKEAFGILMRDHIAFAQLWGVVYIEANSLGEPELAERADQVFNHVVELVGKGQQEGYFMPGMPATWLAATFCGLAETAWELVLEEWMGARQAPEFIEAMLLRGGGV
ncbi:TetR/AcrR family transcriptional repressor of mexCD-oprJ operon [Crossiella equi]|uniref:TetR/AcrR family transcriptional repressor of mexCD-oprJ operon n=1 Tax=Crossiella equi TaxID=130796 RepID=A0ABS5A6S7_9PSEU|nr:TetR/AcrR family transcriptional regulator [Crossiella equi]MBP2472309.1 TetR/AcrR family transcriptional repressor of mexCD-oprJ operon [Crossiella equi]